MALIDRFAFATLTLEEVDNALLDEIYDLFSHHYSVRDEDYTQRGGHVRLSPQLLVKANSWDKEYAPDETRKILLVCRKP